MHTENQLPIHSDLLQSTQSTSYFYISIPARNSQHPLVTFTDNRSSQDWLLAGEFSAFKK